MRAYFDTIKIMKAMEFAITAPFVGADDSYSPYIYEGRSFFMPGREEYV